VRRAAGSSRHPPPNDTPWGYTSHYSAHIGADAGQEVDCRPMDPRDRTPPFENGVDCAVCGRTVPVERIRILASRDDLTFVELACAACQSESLGMIVGGESADGQGRYGEFLPADHARFREAVPIGADDVMTVRRLLQGGDLDALVGRGDAPGGTTG
jgi:hypothetical protein